jgi:hypothetical protein
MKIRLASTLSAAVATALVAAFSAFTAPAPAPRRPAN